MVKNYFIIALRNLRRHRAYAFLNIAGLAIGMACFLMIALYIADERQYDRFHANADRIVRINSHYSNANSIRSFARSNPAIGPTLLQDFPEIAHTVRFQRFQGTLAHQDKVFNEKQMFFVEAPVFEIFSFPLVKGDPATALSQPNTAVLTEAAATRYFGETDPMGQVLMLSDTLAFTVTGVAREVPKQSHLQFDILLSFETWKRRQASQGRDLDTLWTSGTYYTYALLTSPDVLDQVEAQLPDYISRYVGDQAGDETIYSLGLQRLTEIHLQSDLRQELGPNGSRTALYIFGAIAIFILLISCINFMNLATARSAKRAREVGVRKALGALREQLAGQFLYEALVLSGIALVLAAVLVVLMLPGFNTIAGKSLALTWATHWWYLPLAIWFAALVGVLAGSYPAFLLSGFRPIEVLKGRLDAGHQRSGLSLRKGLVVFQFALSIAIIAGTLVAMQQLHFMQSQNLGFEQEQVLVLPFNWDQAVIDNIEPLKARFLEDNAVQHVTASGDVPGRMFTSMGYWVEGLPEDASPGINALIVDPDFTETYELEMVAGRDFSPELAADLGETFILNETAVAEMGMTPAEVIGKQFRMNNTGPVIGVVKDFHFEGLQNTLEPLVMTVWPSWFGYISLRLSTTDLPSTLASVEQAWSTVMPNRPFEYFFLDDDFAQQYQAEQRFEQIFKIFAFLAIVISCLGLFGLAAFTAEQRTKEIGVRKVLGASVSSIILLLSKDFARLLLLAMVAGAPVAYFAMQRWLTEFAYRIDISWSIFVLAGLAALGIALLTVSYQAVKAAVADPVQSLRCE